MKATLEADPWSFDETSLNIPWRTVSAPTRPIRFGLITEDPKRPLHPTMLRTMREAERAITTAGHIVFSIDHLIPSIWDTATLSWKYFLLDPQKTAVKHVLASGEPWIPSITKTKVSDLDGWSPSLDDLFDMNLARAKILKMYHEIVIQNKLDAVIMPPYQATAVPHDTYGFPIYTILPNCLDYPACSIPFLKADRKLDEGFVRDIAYEPQCEF
jgi:amidase